MEIGGGSCYSSQIYIGASSDNSTPYCLVVNALLRIFSLSILQTLMMSDDKDNTTIVYNQSVTNTGGASLGPAWAMARPRFSEKIVYYACVGQLRLAANISDQNFQQQRDIFGLVVRKKAIKEMKITGSRLEGRWIGHGRCYEHFFFVSSQ
jgi:hypothetical protein